MYERQYVHMHIRILMFLPINPPLALLFASLNPSCITHPPVYLLGDLFYFARGVNTHPSCPWLAINCSPLSA
jgi:hypothetical protein